MYGITLAAFYHRKTDVFLSLLEDLQAIIKGVLGPSVTIRPLEDVHATLLGLMDPTPKALAAISGADLDRDVLHRAFEYRRIVATELGRRHVSICIGGYDATSDYGYLSRGEPLHERSFFVSDRKVVLIGWPRRGERVSTDLDDLRHMGTKFGFRHKYFDDSQNFDPDAYFVIADVTGQPPGSALTRVVRLAREHLDKRTVTFPLAPTDIDVISYLDHRLPVASSCVLRRAPT